jgi:hypothetical protein
VTNEANTHRCPVCGLGMGFAILDSTVEVSLLVFCPGCGHEMDRTDALGEIEAGSREGKPGTSEEFLKQPNVLHLEARLDDD